MPDRLVAHSADGYLTPWAVVNRLKSQFSYVEADGEEGRRYVLATIERLKANSPARDRNASLLAHLARVKNRALFVCFGDNAGSDLTTLSGYVIPGMPLIFDYASPAHEHAVRPLLVRCAEVLGYEMRKDRRILDDPTYTGEERRSFGGERRRFIERRSPRDRRKPQS